MRDDDVDLVVPDGEVGDRIPIEVADRGIQRLRSCFERSQGRKARGTPADEHPDDAPIRGAIGGGIRDNEVGAPVRVQVTDRHPDRGDRLIQDDPRSERAVPLAGADRNK